MKSFDTNPFGAFAPPVRQQTALRKKITQATRRAEAECVADILPQARLPEEGRASVAALATKLVTRIRAKRKSSGVEALIQEYSLSSEEGVALMCLSEALLRIPDRATRDALIRDKIADGNWRAHLGGGRSLFVNAATWGLVVTGTLTDPVDDKGLAAALRRIVAQAGEPVVRKGMDLAMKMMGEQFVTGEMIEQALRNAREREAEGFTFSFDMLGEAAVTQEDADRYFAEYENALLVIGKAARGRGIHERPGISIKLSALHPRYERAKGERVMNELLPRLQRLAGLASGFDIGLNIDAEEADRLELSLDLFESLALDPALAGWDGLGFVAQAYGKRCPYVIDWLVDLARRADRRIMVRLVKGAYWDAEIKRAQVDGLEDFPVYTRKVHTDAAFIACARRMLAAPAEIYPQFATHNAQTLAAIYWMAGPDFTPGDYEFQCLHGMGEPLYEEVVGPGKLDRPCRIYAPVGKHDTLLAYLVRRLLENGANSSFVHRIGDPSVPLTELIADPVETICAMEHPGSRHGGIALPRDLFDGRPNSMGLDLKDESTLAALSVELVRSAKRSWLAEPMVAGLRADRPAHAVRNPADRLDVVGSAAFALEEDVAAAVKAAAAAATDWSATPAEERAAMLERAADLMQARMPLLMGLVIREAGKSAANAVAEVREAIDFLRYYALQVRTTFGPEQVPLGPIACISPWNFPLAIFTGQVSAALAAGNPALAKPAEETPLIAAEAVRILREAGIPEAVLQLLPGDGAIGAALVAAQEVAAVMFTGSTQVARLIEGQLAGRLGVNGKPVPLIAETGGINAMIVDSSALAEQVVQDAVVSAFDSAGQRCSALRVLCQQEDVADRTAAMLKGALRELEVSNPVRLSVDVGPVISAEAKETIERHIEEMRALGCTVTQCALPPETKDGTFVAPTIIEMADISMLEKEVFGPVLHVVRFRRENLAATVDAINGRGYGLTFGLQTRLDGTVEDVTRRIEAGNIYVNRNTIGAVVGVQPFGGRALSGTGPKAGGPLYLGRLVETPPALPAGIQDPVLADFIRGLEAQGETQLADVARSYGSVGGNGYSAELPGPVGERNIYELRPRGLVLLRPASRNGLIQQLAAVLATGNEAVLEGADLPEGLPESVARRISARSGGTLSAALVEGEGEEVCALLRELAELPGPVVPVQSATSQECARGPAYFTHWLVEEVSISINTTAAGGNASLIMLE